jgi:ABC-2 type transport system ATP-binding protein
MSTDSLCDDVSGSGNEQSVHRDSGDRHMGHVIETEGLTKQFGELVAVNDLTLTVRAGECYAFLGRNGSGKSTTARLLLDFIRPTRGRSRVLGGSGADPGIRRRVGYLPGDLHLPRSMSGEEAFRYFGSLGRGLDKAQVDSLCQRFLLNPARPFRDLSTGNRRKVGLVLAFMGDPELLILDEPTSGLDPVLQGEFRDLLAERKEAGATIWMSSHVMAEVERVADRVGLIDEGRLALEMSMDELRRKTTGRLVFTFASPTSPDPFASLPGVAGAVADGSDVTVRVDGSVASVLRTAGDFGALSVRSEQRDLDDVFIDLYEGAGRE